MVAVPVDTAVTTPVVLTLITEGLLLLQVPPETVAVSGADEPGQSADEPDIAPAVGSALTVNDKVAILKPQLPDTE
jgi:hypothetical protein